MTTADPYSELVCARCGVRSTEVDHSGYCEDCWLLRGRCTSCGRAGVVEQDFDEICDWCRGGRKGRPPDPRKGSGKA